MIVAEELETNLERSADTEDTVVGLLSRKTLDGGLDDVVLFGDEVVEPNSSQRCSLYSDMVCCKVRTSGDQGTTRSRMNSCDIVQIQAILSINSSPIWRLSLEYQT